MFTKAERAAGGCFTKLSFMYKGTQSASALNWSGGHLARRPSSWRMGNQWSAITSGGPDSQAAAQGMNHSEVLMSSLESVVPASNSRRLHLTLCAQSLSAARVSYLLGRMSSIFTPLGRAASCSGMLSSSSCVARFLGGDGCAPWSCGLHFRCWAGSLLSVEAASGCGTSMVMSPSSLSEMTTSAMSSGSGLKRG